MTSSRLGAPGGGSANSAVAGAGVAPKTGVKPSKRQANAPQNRLNMTSPTGDASVAPIQSSRALEGSLPASARATFGPLHIFGAARQLFSVKKSALGDV